MAPWREVAARLKRSVRVLGLAARHPSTPWYARALAAALVAYAVSPIDLIPDVIPILGYLDDLILLPAGAWLVMKLIPPPVWDECTARVEQGEKLSFGGGWAAAAIIILLWAVAAYFTWETLWPTVRSRVNR